MKSLIPHLLIISLIVSAACSKDDDPTGPEAGVNKGFTIALEGLQSSVAYTLLVSPDGTKILAGINNEVNPDFYYSDDGGSKFSTVAQTANAPLRYATDVSNNGLVLTSQRRLFELVTGKETSVTGGEIILLGDKGKVFVYSQNFAAIYYRTITDPKLTEVTKPIDAKPGSASLYFVAKVPGKGIAFIASPTTRADKSIQIHILDEESLTWTSKTVAITWSKINTCASVLLMSEAYSFGSQTKMIMKGCSGMAIIDVTTGDVKYAGYPVAPNDPNATLDGKILINNNGNMFVSASSATYLASHIFQYQNEKWEQNFSNLSTSSALAMDLNGNLYYNTTASEGTLLKAAVKLNPTTNTRTVLALPKSQEEIFEGIALQNEVIFISALQLFRFDITAKTIKKIELKNISHFNVLSDGRWVAGGLDEIYISTDQGTTWTKKEKLFSPSLTQLQVPMTVTETRLVKGELLIVGTGHSTYNNLTLGITQHRYDNMVVTQEGKKLNYQFPNDLQQAILAPDGTIYGHALFIGGFSGGTMDFYEIKPDLIFTRLAATKGPTPHVITDSGVQITLKGISSDSWAVYSRKSVDEEWQLGTNTPPLSVPASGPKLRIANSGLTLIDYHMVWKTE